VTAQGKETINISVVGVRDKKRKGIQSGRIRRKKREGREGVLKTKGRTGVQRPHECLIDRARKKGGGGGTIKDLPESELPHRLICGKGKKKKESVEETCGEEKNTSKPCCQGLRKKRPKPSDSRLKKNKAVNRNRRVLERETTELKKGGPTKSV